MKFLATLFVLILSFPSFGKRHSDTIPYPYFVEIEGSENEMIALHQGEEALQLRLDLIKKAKRTIEVEYYIYNMDLSSKIFTRELVKAAERGVKVRILVDKFAGLIDKYVAHELLQKGVELKYYSTKSVIKLWSINYRNHRKLVIVDDEEAITGGRNMGDDYFNLDHSYNFEDRDVYVKGSIVKAMKDSFDVFYENKISHFVRRGDRPELRVINGETRGLSGQKKWDGKVMAAQAFLKETEEELFVREAIEKTARIQLKDKTPYTCPTASFVSDVPGANFLKEVGKDYGDSYRNVRKTFLDKILPIDKALTISSPYFIANTRNEFIFEDLLKRGVEVNLYSNSLKSTDAIFMSAALYIHMGSWLKKGLNIFLHDGKFSGISDLAMESARNAHWGTHAKTHVYETSTYSEVMIGTYNVDNRSDQYNTELALFCKGNDEFSAHVKDDIEKLSGRALEIKNLRHAIDRDGNKINITGASPFKQLKMKLLTVPSWLIKFLL